MKQTEGKLCVKNPRLTRTYVWVTAASERNKEIN